ncbi:MAG TPA: AmmeMemoRadiSam system radical SAM enzyme [Armatimonadetes bacterium]|nr:AmmeMemoRadiSam system radical SAM enzyme [Armatimonadota bacterium]
MEDGRIHCYLCPRHCHLREGQTGFCYVRRNEGGKLYALAYAQPYAVHVDPIEKKPLFHFLPGTTIFSLGTAGCNMGCKFCQNWDLSKAQYDQGRAFNLPPGQAVELAQQHGCASLAYTYNEPTVFAEYVMDLAREGRKRGLKSAMVTNGYITQEALPQVYENIDAANVDLKAFSEDFYRKLTLSHLKPVLETLKELQRRKVWLEITNLVIPTLNDDPAEIRQMCEWILENLGDRVPLHFTAFHPDFKLLDKPRTSPQTLRQARRTALEVGLKYVYLGNILDVESATTYCPECGAALIQRGWHDVLAVNVRDGKCTQCGADTDIIWGEAPSARVGRRWIRMGY